MEGLHRVWHPTKEDATFPRDFRLVAEVEAGDLEQAAKEGASRLTGGDVVVDPQFVVHVFEEFHGFKVRPYRIEADDIVRYIPPGSELREAWRMHDMEFAKAVLCREPSPQEVERIVENQRDLYIGQSEDRAIEEDRDDYYRKLEREDCEQMMRGCSPGMPDIEIE